jgi:hypothetical protein
MKDFELKVGDLVRLRDDLENGKSYEGMFYIKNMKFKGFRQVTKLCEVYDIPTIKINSDNQDYHYTKEMLAEVKRPTKYTTIYKREEPILDDKEREYLANVIKPFRDKVKCIVKYKNYYNRSEYIAISLKNDTPIHLPYFNEDTMYKNMELNTEYILKELGL